MDLISNKKFNKDNTLEKKNSQKTKKKLLFKTIAYLEKFNHYKSKKISKCKSSSTIVQKRKNSEKKKNIFIPINLKGPSIKTNNVKKKISYNRSTSELFNERYINFNYKINNNGYININKSKKNSQHNTINYIINNLSSKKKESVFQNKFNEMKGINKSIIPPNNNNNTNSNNNNFNNNNNNNLIYEELKKENETLLLLFNEKIKENKKYKNKINYLQNKIEQVLKK